MWLLPPELPPEDLIGPAISASPISDRHVTAGRAARVPAWDLPTRLFKWLLVLAVATAWLTQWRGDAGMPWHIWNGYAILVLLVFRLLWGIVGSSTARFSAWVKWPWTVVAYAAKLLRGAGRPYLGHNPLGAYMILALMVIVGSQAVAGLFTVDNNGILGGPFSNLDFGDPTPVQRTLSRYHHWAFNLVLAFVTVHILVNLFYQFVKKDPVVRAMITGTKPPEPFADEPAMTRPPMLALRAALCLAVAIAVVFGAIKMFGGTIA